MPAIVVSALMIEHQRVLLIRTTDGVWDLPGTDLADVESIDDALKRALGHVGVFTFEEEFLDTSYERTGNGAPLIRNVFRVRAWQEPPQLVSTDRFSELGWFGLHDVSRIELTDSQRAILRDGLAAEAGASLPGAPITIITGPAASGKTTVASRLCRRLDRAAHVEVDLLRDMIIGGYASPLPAEEGDPVYVAEQTRLASTNAAALARNFSLRGYEVAIDGVIETADALDQLLADLSGVAPVSLITLLPDAVALQSRDAIRDPDLRLGERCLDLLRIYESNGEERGLRLDNSHMSVSETVSWILANRDRARVL